MKKRIQKLSYYVSALLFAVFGFIACEQETLTIPVAENGLAFDEADAILAGKYTKSIEIFDVEGTNSVKLTIAAKDKSLLEEYDCNTISLVPKFDIKESTTDDDITVQTETPVVDFSERIDNAIIIKVESQSLQEGVKGFDINVGNGEEMEARDETRWLFWYGLGRRARVSAPNVPFSRYDVSHFIWNPSQCGGWCSAGGAYLYPSWVTTFYSVSQVYHGVLIGHKKNKGTYCNVTIYYW